jgi:hypothetical protein
LTGGCVFLPNNIFFPFWLEVLSCFLFTVLLLSQTV